MHAFDECGDALCVAVATTLEMYILDDVVVVEDDSDASAACAVGGILNFPHDSSGFMLV